MPNANASLFSVKYSMHDPSIACPYDMASQPGGELYGVAYVIGWAIQGTLHQNTCVINSYWA